MASSAPTAGWTSEMVHFDISVTYTGKVQIPSQSGCTCLGISLLNFDQLCATSNSYLDFSPNFLPKCSQYVGLYDMMEFVHVAKAASSMLFGEVNMGLCPLLFFLGLQQWLTLDDTTAGLWDVVIEQKDSFSQSIRAAAEDVPPPGFLSWATCSLVVNHIDPAR